MSRGLVAALSLCLLMAALAAPADAQDAPPQATEAQLSDARSLFERGLASADAERWGEAVELFRRARDLVERPSIVFNLGQALMRLGQATEARSALERFASIADPRADARDIAEAQRLLRELSASQATLELALEPPESVVEVDGAVVQGEGSERTLTLDPGRHRISVSAPGFRADRFEVSALSGSRERRSAILERLPSRPATLVVHASEGSEVRVDGLLVGRGEIESELVPGEHRVVVSEGGAPVLERDVTVGEGDRLVLDAVVQRAGGSLVEEPWLWIVVGLAVVGAGVGVGLGIALSEGPADPVGTYAGTRGVVLAALRFE